MFDDFLEIPIKRNIIYGRCSWSKLPCQGTLHLLHCISNHFLLGRFTKIIPGTRRGTRRVIHKAIGTSRRWRQIGHLCIAQASRARNRASMGQPSQTLGWCKLENSSQDGNRSFSMFQHILRCCLEPAIRWCLSPCEVTIEHLQIQMLSAIRKVGVLSSADIPALMHMLSSDEAGFICWSFYKHNINFQQKKWKELHRHSIGKTAT